MRGLRMPAIADTMRSRVHSGFSLSATRKRDWILHAHTGAAEVPTLRLNRACAVSHAMYASPRRTRASGC